MNILYEITLLVVLIIITKIIINKISDVRFKMSKKAIKIFLKNNECLLTLQNDSCLMHISYDGHIFSEMIPIEGFDHLEAMDEKDRKMHLLLPSGPQLVPASLIKLDSKDIINMTPNKKGVHILITDT